MEWRDQLNHYIEMINHSLREYTNIGDERNHLVVEAMQYSLFAGGKRLRPVLTLAVTEMLNGTVEKAMPYACALEMIHTYSLIHDDLPAMDNDDFRRGKPTNHKIFGDGVAILAGDGLLNLAYEIMLQDLLLKKNPDSFIRAMKCIGNAAGVRGMIGGQTADLINEGKSVTAETLTYIHQQKTGALLSASLTAGAYAAEADEQTASELAAAGHALGMAFQIQDDLLDLDGSAEELGKPIGSDLRNNKATFPSLYGIDDSRKQVKSLTNKTLATFKSYGESSEFLQSLARYLVNRRS
ncbi:polyprenyl synthetase family protein [Anoxynatronum buryatiense]|uniref:Farnesyl diphosphate synthase n=1 Tax=Anoxynatronum buryatiense TaxID=489973 RepID=A0AA46AIF8_9CLOT|nr:farnesyl diphosphate synthase [Anoxynatronum buryatiense]SMP48465.1 farnesyl-diphosphate synthase [Anoxynatronum buryatiense]